MVNIGGLEGASYNYSSL